MNGKEDSCNQARSQISTGGRRSVNSRPPSNLHSDCPPEQEEDSPSLGQRSISLTTLQSGIIQPRMAQLETLEAKMASIEVSLSSTPRRKKNGSIGGLSLGSSIRSIPREIATKELENLRNALRDKENIIQSLKGQLTIPGLRLLNMKNVGSTTSVANRELTDNEKKQAEERLNRLKTDVDNKRLAIKNLKMALERLDITDNIDVRIQQAELEYQLGREELNLLTLLEETRTLQLCLDESNKSSASMNTLFSCIYEKEQAVLVGVEVEYDPKSPKFGAGEKEHGGLWIDWALEDSGLYKEDRIIEVNGKIVLTKTREDLARLLAAAPDPAQMVVLRKLSNDTSLVRTSNDYKKEVTALRTELDAVRERAEEAQRSKDGLRSDNLRLTHRISYLEEQVSELLSRKLSDPEIKVPQPPIVSTVKTNQNVTNINITTQRSDPASPSGSSCSKDIQVFQKGPQVTALVANIPGMEVNRDNHTSLPVRSKSSLSNVSNAQISSSGHQSNDNHSSHKIHRHKQKSRSGMSSSCSSRTFDQKNDNITYRKHGHHHHHYREKDYSSETNSAIDQIARYNKKNLENGHKTVEKETNQQSNNIMDQSYQKATKIVNDLTKRSDVNSYEKHRQKCLMASEKYNGDLLKHYNARKSTSVLDFRSEIHIGPKYSECKSTEELNGSESDNNFRQRIQNSHSMKCLDFDSDCNSTKTNGKHFSCNNKVDYTSEPLNSNKKINNYYTEQHKSRPMPPKKPLRLSLHKAQSLQSVDSNDHKDPRKSLKRSYKGEISRFSELNGEYNGHSNSSLKWNFGQNQRIVENGVEMTGSWC